MIDVFANCIASIKNGLKVKKIFVDVPQSKKLVKFLLFFVKQGFLSGILLDQDKKIFRIFLKYVDSKPVISGIIRISKPSRRIYISVETIKRTYSPAFTLMLSTNVGYISSYAALNSRTGGECVCVIY